MRRHYWIIPLVIVLACLIRTDQARSRELRIVTDAWPPYEDIKNTDAPGFSVEVIRHVMDQMDVAITITQHPWPRVLRSVYAGAADACFSAFFTPERAEHAIYPDEPLTTADYVLFIRKADRARLRFNALEDLDGKTIGIVRDAAYPEAFLVFIRARCRVEAVSRERVNLLKLINNRLDYAVMNYANGVIMSKQMDALDQVVPLTAIPVKQDKVYLIFSKKTVSPAFAVSFSDALRRFKSTPEYRQIYKRYFDPWQYYP